MFKKYGRKVFMITYCTTGVVPYKEVVEEKQLRELAPVHAGFGPSQTPAVV